MAKAVTLKNSNGDELYPTTIAELVNGLDEKLQDVFFYKPGDTVTWSPTNGGPNISGYLTNSNKDLRFFIPLQKRLDNISSVTLNSFECLCRIPAGGYATGLGLPSGDIASLTDSLYCEVVKELGGIYVRAHSATNWASVNNVPVSFECLGFSLTLS